MNGFIALKSVAEEFEKRGLPPYSRRHLSRLIEQGRFPKPIEISKNRKVITEEQLEEYLGALRALAEPAAPIDPRFHGPYSKRHETEAA